MAQPGPLTERCAQAVMLHLEANRRYQLSARAPSLRTMHKSLPIKLDSLKLYQATFRVNGISHMFRSKVQEPLGGAPLPIHLQDLNQGDGVTYDITENGAKEKNDDLLFQDVRIGGIRFAQDFINNFNENSGSLEGQLGQFFRAAGAQYRGGPSAPAPVPCIPYILFVMRNGEKRGSVEYPLGNKIRHSIRRHLGNVLGNGAVFVRHLEVGITDGFLRFPESLKIRCKEMRLQRNGNAVIHAIRPVLNERSFPLTKISVLAQEAGDPVFQNQIVKSSVLIEVRIDEDPDGNWAQAFKKLPNRSIHLAVGEIPIEELGELAMAWMESPRAIGYKFTMPCEDVATILERAGEVLPVARATIESRRCDQFPVCASVQISEDRELNIYGSTSPNHEAELAKEGGLPWMIVMESMPLGSARPV